MRQRCYNLRVTPATGGSRLVFLNGVGDVIVHFLHILRYQLPLDIHGPAIYGAVLT